MIRRREIPENPTQEVKFFNRISSLLHLLMLNFHFQSIFSAFLFGRHIENTPAHTGEGYMGHLWSGWVGLLMYFRNQNSFRSKFQLEIGHF